MLAARASTNTAIGGTTTSAAIARGTADMATNTERLAKLLQLASPALPVGAYSYSGGLEAAIETGVVSDAASAERWIGAVLEHSVANMEAPVLLRLCAAWRVRDAAALERWNELFLASRETAELRAETVQMGYSLHSLLGELGVPTEGMPREPAYPTAYACALERWGIEPERGLVAYLWAWLENQVTAAVKALPLGQSEGQRMLLALGARLEEVAARAGSPEDEELENFAPQLAVLSARHETQYSRLFRS
jgi:urease accessory protein